MSGAQPTNTAAAGPGPQSMNRRLLFSSMKPPFVPHEDYHRFPSSKDTAHRVGGFDQVAEAIVVKSPVSLDPFLSHFYRLFWLVVYGLVRAMNYDICLEGCECD